MTTTSQTLEVESASEARRVCGRSLIGDLGTMLASDMLLWIATRKKTGTLQCWRRSTRKLFVFQAGLLRSCSSNDPREKLGQFLLREHLITEEDLFRALERQERLPGVRLGELLAREGRITREQLADALRARAEETLYELLLWDDGGFVFQQDVLPASDPLNLALDAQSIAQQGSARRARWRRIREAFIGNQATFKPMAGGPLPAEPAERRLLELAMSGKSVAEISLLARRSEFSTAEYLHGLCELGVLALDRVVEDREEADPVGAIEQLLALADRALGEGDQDAAFEAYEDVLALDPLSRAARKGLVAVSDARKRERTARRIVRGKVPILRIGTLELAKQTFTPEEGFVLSRINGKWDVDSILKLCPLAEEQALDIFGRLLDRKIIELR